VSLNEEEKNQLFTCYHRNDHSRGWEDVGYRIGRWGDIVRHLDHHASQIVRHRIGRRL
jgi:hypothetical protein